MIYAKIIDARVVDLIVADLDFFDGFVDDSAGEWREVSGDVGIGYETHGDIICPPKPYDSWIFIECEWVAPAQKPDGDYDWNEELQEWVLLEY